jgi:cytochrome c peroxidase
MKHSEGITIAFLLTLMLSAIPYAAAGAGPVAPAPSSTTPPPASPVSIGELAFNDKSLSAGGNLACANCHAKTTGHADPAGTFMPMGGPKLDQQGYRISMSLNYLTRNTPFAFGPDGRPHGGFFWDGRASSRQQQAAAPLFGATEMANTSADSLASKLKHAPYYANFARVYGVPANASSAAVVAALQLALATYQAADSSFMLFNSKFDKFLDGTAQLTASELRGWNLFNDPRKGHCASCHSSDVGADGSRPIFTNFGYHAHGLPRNMAILANADPHFFDMGLCGPKRTDLAFRLDLCGMFRTPTLRNVALRAPYFHNATAATLEQAISFYATRDVTPAVWYPLVNGHPDKFNDLPPSLRGNVDPAPVFAPGPGNTPRLSIQDVIDLAAFLRTLTDNVTALPGSPFLTGTH